MGPLSVLHQMGLTDQVAVLHNYYMKIELVEGLSDAEFVAQLRRYNEKQNAEVFHSLFNGESTLFVTPPRVRPEIPPFVCAPEGKAAAVPTVTSSVLVLEDPPIRLPLTAVASWAVTKDCLTLLPLGATGPLVHPALPYPSLLLLLCGSSYLEAAKRT